MPGSPAPAQAGVPASTEPRRKSLVVEWTPGQARPELVEGPGVTPQELLVRRWELESYDT